jgi:hypothetical protein
VFDVLKKLWETSHYSDDVGSTSDSSDMKAQKADIEQVCLQLESATH